LTALWQLAPRAELGAKARRKRAFTRDRDRSPEMLIALPTPAQQAGSLPARATST